MVSQDGKSNLQHDRAQTHEPCVVASMRRTQLLAIELRETKLALPEKDARREEARDLPTQGDALATSRDLLQLALSAGHIRSTERLGPPF